MSRRPWKKILWIEQGVPDNYVDSSFLALLVTNANVRVYNYWNLVSASSVFSQHFSTVVVFCALFVHSYLHWGGGEGEKMENESAWRGGGWLLLLDALLLGMGSIIATLIRREIQENPWKFWVNGLQRGGLMMIALFMLSPVLRTLTESISTDTIWTSAFFLLFLHLAFHDFSYVAGSELKLDGAISVNAAIFAAVLLASRLTSATAVVALLSLALQLLILAPILYREIKSRFPKAHLLLTFFTVSVAFVLLFPLSPACSFCLLVFILSVTFFAPLLLVKIQKYKRRINGPWDEAVPR